MKNNKNLNYLTTLYQQDRTFNNKKTALGKINFFSMPNPCFIKQHTSLSICLYFEFIQQNGTCIPLELDRLT